ncbi:TfoX/Sxy family protein [Porticoccus sp.]
MPASRAEQQFVAYLVDLLQVIGPARAKRMFGGHGIFLDGLMFALVVDGTLYLKADAKTQEHFLQRGLEVFSYIRQNKPCQLCYYQAPEETLDDPDEMRSWANKAYACAVRAASKHPKTAKPL